jgi:chromosome partitioning protein
MPSYSHPESSAQQAQPDRRRCRSGITSHSAQQQKGGVGKTTTAANIGVLLAQQGGRVLLVDTDPQFALTRQLGLEIRALGVNLVDVLAGRALAGDATVSDVHGLDLIPGARDLAGVEMSLVSELGRERFLHDGLAPVLDRYQQIVIDTPPNLGLLTVNALVCADHVIAPVSGEDEASLHGVIELRTTIARLADRIAIRRPELTVILTRWQRHRISSRHTEQTLRREGLAPTARIPARSALFTRAATQRIPIALSDPDSAPTLAYRHLADLLTEVTAR